MNPYYDSDKLGWDVITFDEPDMSYEFNMLCFWKTKNGLIFSASDSGCSCPSPFEEYDSNTEAGIEQQLERVGSFEQAKRIFDSWNSGYNEKPFLNSIDVLNDMNKLKGWFK